MLLMSRVGRIIPVNGIDIYELYCGEPSMTCASNHDCQIKSACVLL